MQADGRTDRHDEANSALRNFANARNRNTHIRCMKTFCSIFYLINYLILKCYIINVGAWGSVVVKALRY
jgi:hypothetical protein